MDRSQLPKFERDEITISMVIMGILFPVICLWGGLDAWITQNAKWPQRYARDIPVQGGVAVSLGVAYIGIGLACFSHWCFRYFGLYGLRVIGLIVGSVAFVGGVVVGLVLMAGG